MVAYSAADRVNVLLRYLGHIKGVWRLQLLEGRRTSGLESHELCGSHVFGHEKAGEPVDHSSPGGTDGTLAPTVAPEGAKRRVRLAWCYREPQRPGGNSTFPEALERQVGLDAKQASAVEGHVHGRNLGILREAS